jgi:hypothetical protein
MEPVRIGVPLPRGTVAESDVGSLAVVDRDGRPVPHQGQAAARWHDRTIRWLLVDLSVSIGARSEIALFLVRAGTQAAAPLDVQVTGDGCRVDTGAARYTIPSRGEELLSSVEIAGRPLLGAPALLALTDRSKRVYRATIDHLTVPVCGSVRAEVLVAGRFVADSDAAPLLFTQRYEFYRGLGAVRLHVLIRNLRAARHKRNLWDLGDPGSLFFDDLSLELAPERPTQRIAWCTDHSAAWGEHESRCWTLYQDSSGGEQWRSSNHVDAAGQATVTFRGFEVRDGEDRIRPPLAAGLRAQPCVMIPVTNGRIAATVEDFWQNFPKALRWREDRLEVGLFPRESRGSFELQGGEQKRHAVWLEFDDGKAALPAIVRFQQPLDAWVDPAAVESAATIEYFTRDTGTDHSAYRGYVDSIVAGPRSFVELREAIDEYGWRNFGDLYADHEAVKHTGPKPLVSHYNNQYDFVHAAGVHYLRTGDSRWKRLMAEAARHTIDIDIYHTDRDRSAYNGGLFWHTDHYQDAATSTHRTYSRHNARSSDYGGGPSNEHNYTSGLLLYWYLSGDSTARAAVQGLADWVIAMDDGASTLAGVIDAGPTGAATRTVAIDYHKPGRGAANSVNALLDGYAVSTDRRYLLKAEELIRRCIHPTDDVAALRLGEPEHRWSYLMFLQVLGKYLDVKAEMRETDFGFYYARDSLLRYADWMLEHEVPYKQVLHKVSIPTETWSAHDMRKCHVLHLAARYSKGERRAAFAAKATFFFERCLEDLLSFPTALLTRPRVILAGSGYVHGFYIARGYGRSDDPDLAPHGYCLGDPQRFVPQRLRLRQALRSRARLLGGELWRVICEQVGDTIRKLYPRRYS